MKKEKFHAELKLTDLIEKPISSNLFDEFNVYYLYLNLKYIYENIFGLIEYDEDEYLIYHMFFYENCYYDFIVSNNLSDTFKEYDNLIELLKDRLNLNLKCNIYNLSCYGETDEDCNEYLAHLDRRLCDAEFEIFESTMNSCGYKLYDNESIFIGENDEFDVDLIFIYYNNKLIDYYIYDNMYDTLDLLQLHDFINVLFKACPDLFNGDYSLIKKIIEYKNNKETKEIVF